MPLPLNQPAPGFELYDTDKKKVSLHDFRHKNVIVLFFPFAFSSVCTKEFCEMRDSYSFYESMNAAVIGISVDSLYTNARFRQENHFNFPLLSDFNKEVSQMYDVLDAEAAFGYRGVSKRAVFVIDKNGLLTYQEILPSSANYPDMDNLKLAVASLK